MESTKNNNIYLIYGEEKYEVERAVEKIKKGFTNLEKGVNFLILDNSNINELEEFLSTVSFFGDKKLAIIKDTNLKFDADLVLEYADENMVVCIVEDKVDKRSKEYKKLKKVCNEFVFDKMTPEETVRYIISILRKYEIIISKENAEYLDHKCSNDKNNLINEFKKLTSYFAKGKTLTKEDIDLVCAKTMQDEIFTLVDYVLKEDKIKCLATLEEMFSFKEPAQKIAVMLYRRFRELYVIKNMLLQDKNANIAGELGMHPYRAKLLAQTAQKFSINKLEKVLSLFGEYDYKTKIGDMDFEIGLKQLVCNI